jgi:WD40 repeat protein
VELLSLANNYWWVDLLKFSPDGTYLVANGDDTTTVRVWNIPELLEQYPEPPNSPLSNAELYNLIGHDANVAGSTFSPAGRFLFTGGQGGSIKMWDLESGAELLSLVSKAGAVNSLAVSQECSGPPDFPFEWCGRYLVSSHGDGVLRVWDISPIGAQEIATVPGYYGIFNQDGSKIIAYDLGCDDTGCWFPSGNVWQLPESYPRDQELDPAAAQTLLLGPFELPEPDVGATGYRSAGWNEDNSVFGGAYGNKEFITYNASTGDILSSFSLASHPGDVQAIAFSPDGNFIGTGDDSGVVMVWDAGTGEELLSLAGHEDRIDSLDFNPSSNLLVTTSWDGTAKVWDLTSGEEIHELAGHTNWVRSSAFSPDGTVIATGGRDSTVRLWDVNSGDELYSRSGHSSSVNRLDFSPDGSMLASGSWGDVVKVWDSTTGQEILSLIGPNGRGIELKQFSPDGTMLLVTTYDSVSNDLHVLLLPEEPLMSLAQSKLTRWFTDGECLQFLHVDQCPEPP